MSTDSSIQDIGDLLLSNPYPGRGILLGKSEDGKYAVAAYFIMGRSENSRNRVFVAEGEGLRTQAFDESKVEDPSLIIYAPVRVLGGKIIVTNGEQTDTIYEYLQQGKTFGDALRTRTFEPDAPNFTPRISGVLEGEDYTLSILKCEAGEEQNARRYFYEYTGEKPGQGHLIHTYQAEGDPLPSFVGEPRRVSIEGGIDFLTSRIWNTLNSDNKISLFVRFIELSTGRSNTRILNKNS